MLELMIALSILSVLMMVAWSLMGTYQKAEQGSWKLSQRIQTMRAARTWLDADLQHIAPLVQALPNEDPSKTSKVEPSFVGTEYEFTLTTVPSLSPLPFFEQLLNSTSSLDQDSLEALYATEEERMVQEARDARWAPSQQIVEYRLEPLLDPTSEPMPSSGSDADNIVYDLVRSELLDVSIVESSSIAGGTSSGNPLADRVLSTQDLYRLPDEERTKPVETIRESRLAGLASAEFQYFDGQDWHSQWDSQSRGSLPAAVALSFDFQPASQMLDRAEVARLRRKARLAKENGLESLDALSPYSQKEEIAEPSALDDMGTGKRLSEVSESEVLIVVWIASSPRSLANDNRSPINSNRMSAPSGTTTTVARPLQSGRP